MILNKYKAVIRWKHKPEVAGEIRQNAVVVVVVVVIVVVVFVVIVVVCWKQVLTTFTGYP